MSVYDDLASILRKAQGSITEDGGEIDVGREVVMLRSAHEEQLARIKELKAENQRLRDIAQKQRSILNRYDLAPDIHQLLRTLHMEILGGEDEA